MVTNKPYHRDACNHPQDSYIGSFELPNGSKYDVYVFLHHGEQEVCIRDGSNGNAYASPGPLYLFFLASLAEGALQSYKWAARMILQSGTIAFTPHKDEEPQ